MTIIPAYITLAAGHLPNLSFHKEPVNVKLNYD